MRRYPYLIEIRPILEKYILKRLGVKNTPHITLIYKFDTDEAKKIARTIKKIGDACSRLIKFEYSKIVLRKSERGKYVIGLEVEPSTNLMLFRKRLYEQIKDVIIQPRDSKKHNEKDPFWFHSTLYISYNYEKSLRRYSHLKKKIEHIKLPTNVLRVTLLKNSKILYEYDWVTRKILNRKKALSSKESAKTILEYRKLNQNKIKKLENSISISLSHTWIISDLHLYHKNIIKYCMRPFVSTRDMNEYIITQWNKHVNKNDIVFIVGDVCKNRKKRCECILEKLNGNKIILKGNHDVGEYLPEIKESFGSLEFLLKHKPVKPLLYFGWLIHGHVHNNNLWKYPFINFKTKTINVSVEVIGYKPLNIAFLLDAINFGQLNKIDSFLTYEDYLEKRVLENKIKKNMERRSSIIDNFKFLLYRFLK